MVVFVPLAILAAILQAALDSGSRQSPQYRPGPRQRRNRNDRWSSGSDWTYNGGYAGGSSSSWSDGGGSSSSCDSGSSSSSSCGGGSSSSCGGGGSC
ncbi:hypothetical protein HGA10_08850 [Nocardia coubleae]|uniref:Uncharacterized protein n=2 Tax=Nocardia coubleae TaxID=356147 RepID=A0A846W4C8_9NOCA|nr:hypothetical protein [Nocardia coubleae]